MGVTPTGTVTFLFTDIESSTQKWEENAAVMSKSLKIHDCLIIKIVQENHGYVFKTVGDAFCVAFSTAMDCLSASIEIQRQLLTTEWPGAQIKIRMGIHTGEAEERDTDYFGPAVNRAARISSVGHGGQIIISESTHQLVCDNLSSDIKLTSLGKRRLKDLNRPEMIFQVDVPELVKEFPPLKTLDLARNNLPLVLTSFIGRDQELQELGQFFTSSRLITIVGPGGIGKTRLSLQLASDNLDLFSDGIWFVDLVKVVSPEGIPSAILQALGIKEEAASSVLDKAKNYLRAKQTVLILDNCEHLVDAVTDIVDDLLTRCPQLTILATSREALKITGEITYHLSPLTIPGEKDLSTATPESLIAFESVRLFIERAIIINPRFEVINRSAPALAQICIWLDGIPLAIELATARTKMFSIEEIKERLSGNFSFLKGGSRQKHKRQQTLHALIDWSYALLNEEECTLFCRLSVFCGGWTLDSAEAVCDPSFSLESSNESLFEMVSRLDHLSKEEQEAALAWKPQKVQGKYQRLDILDLMESLIEKSLIECHEVNGKRRYRLMESIRFFAYGKLEDNGDKREYMTRLSDYLLPLARIGRIEEIIQGKVNFNWIEEEYTNLVAAVEWSLGAEETQGKALRMITSLSLYWTFRGNVEEGIVLSERAYSITHFSDDSNTRADFLMYISLINSYSSRHTKAMVLMDEYYRMSVTNRPEIGEGYAANFYSMCFSVSDLGKAVELIKKSVAIFDNLDATDSVKIGKAIALGNLAIYTQFMGNMKKARDIQIDVLKFIHNFHHLSLFKSIILTNLSFTELSLGKYSEGLKYAEEAVTLQRELKDKDMAESIYNIASAHRCMGNFTEAEAYYRKVIDNGNDSSDRTFVSGSYICLALIACKKDGVPSVVGYIKESINNCPPIDSWGPVYLESILLYAGAVLSSLKLFDESVMILGAIETKKTLILSNLPACDRGIPEQITVRAKEVLGEELFNSKFALSKEMSLDEVKERIIDSLAKIHTE